MRLHLLVIFLIFCCPIPSFGLVLINKNLKIETRSLPTTSGLSAGAILDAIHAQQSAVKAATEAVNAFAMAAATCQANVTCDQARTQVVTARSYQKTVSTASAKSQQALEDINNSLTKIRANLSTSSTSINGENNEEKSAQYSLETANLAAQQAQIAVQATSSAISSCELVVNVVCNACPDGGAPRSVGRSRSETRFPSRINNPNFDSNSTLPPSHFSNAGEILSNISSNFSLGP
jgi:hypothetical protein